MELSSASNDILYFCVFVVVVVCLFVCLFTCLFVFAPDTTQNFRRAAKRGVARYILIEQNVFPAGLEPATFRVLGGRDNHYTTETSYEAILSVRYWGVIISTNCI